MDRFLIRRLMIFVISLNVMAIGVILFFIFFGFGTFNGVREGTIFAAITVGMIVHFFTKILKKGFYDWIGYKGITSRE